MKKNLLAVSVIGALMSMNLSAQQVNSTTDHRESLNLTLYQGAFAVVQDTRTLTFDSANETIVNVQGVSPEMVVNSVLIEGLHVKEQDYRYNLIDFNNLIRHSIGKSILIKLDEEGKFEPRTLVAYRNGFIIISHPDNSSLTQAIDASEFSDRIRFMEIPSHLSESPTLSLKTQPSQKGEVEYSISYLTNGLNWDASYTANLSEKTMDLSSWVSLSNNTDVNFDLANIQLIAGQVNRAHQPKNMMRGQMDMMVSSAMMESAPIAEESFSDYALFRLFEPVTLLSKENKQVKLFESNNIPFERRYEAYVNLMHSFERARANIQIEFVNNEESNLGIRLPAGVLRFYEADNQGINQLVGETRIPNMDRFESFDATLGQAFHFSIDNTPIRVEQNNAYIEGKLDVQNSRNRIEKIDLILNPIHVRTNDRQTRVHSFCEEDRNKEVVLRRGFDIGDAEFIRGELESNSTCRVTLVLKPEHKHTIHYKINF